MIAFIWAHFKGETIGLAVITFIGTIVGILALSEALTGQLLVALIAALPPTGAVIVALVSLKRGQNAMAIALDGKLDKLMQAEKGVSKAEGVKEERADARDRAVVDAPAATAALVAATVAAVAASPETVSKMEIVNTEDNRVPVKLDEKDAAALPLNQDETRSQ